jgi:hypothetical protein
MTFWRYGGRAPATSFVSTILLLWFIVGAIAAGQRHYYSHAPTNCSQASTIAVTILAGPLNYIGANPKVGCHLPQPSK